MKKKEGNDKIQINNFTPETIAHELRINMHKIGSYSRETRKKGVFYTRRFGGKTKKNYKQAKSGCDR